MPMRSSIIFLLLILLTTFTVVACGDSLYRMESKEAVRFAQEIYEGTWEMRTVNANINSQQKKSLTNGTIPPIIKIEIASRNSVTD